MSRRDRAGRLLAATVIVAANTAACQEGMTAGDTAPAAGAGGIAAHVRRCESGGNYRAENPHSSASGAYQFIDATWTGTTGLRPPASAYAPPVQDRAFHELWNGGRGAHHWNASRGCWGRYWTGR